MIKTISINDKVCHFASCEQPEAIIYCGIAPNSIDTFLEIFHHLQMLAPSKSYLLVGFEVTNWNNDLSPWAAPAAFGNQNFSGCGQQTLDWLITRCMPAAQQMIALPIMRENLPQFIGGYSLSGLFSLWAFYHTHKFDGVASCSASLWFPNWSSFMKNQVAPEKSLIYLSLGKGEEFTKNKMMAPVGDLTRLQYALSCEDPHLKACTLEWHEGGHFKETALRTAKGLAWLLNHLS